MYKTILVRTTAALCAVLIGLLGYAFASSLSITDGTRLERRAVLELPDDYARAKLLRFMVNGRPLWLFFPGARDLDTLKTLDALAAQGSSRPAWNADVGAFAFWGESTYLGCWVAPLSTEHRQWSGSTSWRGGFYDPCHYGWWDYAGRAHGYEYQKAWIGGDLANLRAARVSKLTSRALLVDMSQDTVVVKTAFRGW